MNKSEVFNEDCMIGMSWYPDKYFDLAVVDPPYGGGGGGFSGKERFGGHFDRYIMSRLWRKPDQIIQPWQFGENYQKTTCLWFVGDLPKLIPTVTEKPNFQYHTWIDKNGKQKRQTQWYYDTRRQGKRRGKVASKTPQGLANAMAEQWGGAAE